MTGALAEFVDTTLAGTAIGGSVVTGALATAITLAGTATGGSIVSGDLAVIMPPAPLPPGVWALAADAGPRADHDPRDWATLAADAGPQADVRPVRAESTVTVTPRIDP